MTDEELAAAQAQLDADADRWGYDEDEDMWRLFRGIYQIIKAPKHSTPYAEYWPNAADSAYLIEALNGYAPARAALDALLAVEPLAPYSEYATGRPLTACVYCGVTAPRGTVPHPHDSDCPWARGREARGG